MIFNNRELFGIGRVYSLKQGYGSGFQMKSDPDPFQNKVGHEDLKIL